MQGGGYTDSKGRKLIEPSIWAQFAPGIGTAVIGGEALHLLPAHTWHLIRPFLLVMVSQSALSVVDTKSVALQRYRFPSLEHTSPVPKAEVQLCKVDGTQRCH